MMNYQKFHKIKGECIANSISAMRTLTNLTNLDLSRNSLTDVSDLRTLTNLTNLDLSCNENLTDISDLIDIVFGCANIGCVAIPDAG